MPTIDRTPIDLTPAEAMVLLEPDSKHGREAFKVSLMWLLAQGHLKATKTPTGWFSRGSTQLSRGLRAGAPLPRDLQEVMNTVGAARSGLMRDIVKVANTRFGVGLSAFPYDFIYPSLTGRGLIRTHQQTRRILFVPFTSTRRERTPEGDAVAQQIKALLEDARKIPDYLDRSPAQAAALAATLGGLILLLPELRPHLNDVATAMRRPNDATESGYSPATSTTDSSAWTSSGDRKNSEVEADSPERGDFQIHFDLSDPGLQDFDDFASSLDALDSSFDATSSDSGGGDGGGDGGGGGGD